MRLVERNPLMVDIPGLFTAERTLIGITMSWAVSPFQFYLLVLSSLTETMHDILLLEKTLGLQCHDAN